MLDEELRERENQQMLALMKKYQADDEKAAEKRKIEIARSKSEIMAANAESIHRKQDAKLKELEEIKQLQMYQVLTVYSFSCMRISNVLFPPIDEKGCRASGPREIRSGFSQ